MGVKDAADKVALQLVSPDSHLFTVRIGKPYKSGIDEKDEDSPVSESNKKGRRLRLVGKILAPAGAIATTVYELAAGYGRGLHSKIMPGSDLYKTLGSLDKALYDFASINVPKIGPFAVTIIILFALLSLTAA